MRKTTPAALMQAAILAAFAASVAACDITVGAAEYSVREEKKFTVTGPAQVMLTTFDGSIEVRGWDRSEVQVTVEKRGSDQAAVDKIQVKTSQAGNSITVDVPKPSPMVTTGFRRSPGASLVVSVPIQTTVTARSGDGSIKVQRVTGKVDLDTEDGSVSVDEVKGDLVVRTGDGSVRVREADGRAKISTGDGSIGLDGVIRGGLQVETHDGSIELTARKGSSMDSEWSVTTGDGSIRLELPEGFSADVDALAADGHVEVDKLTHDVSAPANRDDPDSRHAARGKLGAGGNPLRLRSGSGSITVKTW
ncbi:MAG: DUF4097 family beta strand repeat-containing protein [Acidobacteria bacterium]|nr:DUF4097 family beta strand repeat-containing protein [Acidobacteriota bacterium]